MTIYLHREKVKTYDRKDPILQNGDIYVNVEGDIVRLTDLHYAAPSAKRYIIDKYIYSLTIGFKQDATKKYIKQHVPNLSFKWRVYDAEAAAVAT